MLGDLVFPTVGEAAIYALVDYICQSMDVLLMTLQVLFALAGYCTSREVADVIRSATLSSLAVSIVCCRSITRDRNTPVYCLHQRWMILRNNCVYR